MEPEPEYNLPRQFPRENERDRIPRVIWSEHLAPYSDGEPSDIFVIAGLDYDSEPIATVLYTGYPVMVVSGSLDKGQFGTGYDRIDVHCMFDAASGGEQAYAAMVWHLGDVGEEAYSRYADEVGNDPAALDNLLEDSQGYEITALRGRVAHALHAAFPDVTPDVTGF